MSTKNNEKRILPSIKKDYINPRDYLKYDFRYSCEECSHFDNDNQKCSMGYNSIHHQKQTQEHNYRLGGHMALCRFHEID